MVPRKHFAWPIRKQFFVSYILCHSFYRSILLLQSVITESVSDESAFPIIEEVLLVTPLVQWVPLLYALLTPRNSV